jgi:hypothetical protein
MPMSNVFSAWREGREHSVAFDDLHVRKLGQCELDVRRLGHGRQLQQEGGNPVELQVSRASVGVTHASNGRRIVDFRGHVGFGRRVRSAAERNNLGECVETEKIGFVERAYPCLAETAGNAHRHPADAHGFAEPGGQCAAGNQSFDRAGLPRL